MNLNPTTDRVTSLLIARHVLRVSLALGLLAMATMFLFGLVNGQPMLLVMASSTGAAMAAGLGGGLVSVRKDLAAAGVR